MFGEELDYLLLCSIAHKRNISTEEELNTRTIRSLFGQLNGGVSRLHNYIERFGGFFPISWNLHYLDIGCGTGELSIALTKLGCKHVTGIDIVPRNIAVCEFYASQLGVGNSVQFICKDINDWVPIKKYDVLLSFNAFEHIADPRCLLEKMGALLAPDGIAIIAFEPLFHSPFGDHMSGFFRIQIPWRGILFSEKAILRVRKKYYRPTDAAEHYKEIVGGLNLIRYSEFLRYVKETGWKFRFLDLNSSLQRIPPIRKISNVVTRIPIIGDYFVYSISCILYRPANSASVDNKDL